MQPTSLAKAIRILAGYTGKNLDDDREFLVEKVNEIRRAQWKIDSARELLFKRGDQCECVQCFTDECGGCCNKYVGITLPQNVTSLYSLTHKGKVINMRGEPLQNGGCCRSACGCLKAEKLVEMFPLKNPIPAGYKGVLVFKARSKDDKRKRIGVEYIDRVGNVIREDLLASLTGVETSRSVSKMLKITFPERCGWISVRTEQAYELGSYHPAIMSPAHMRLKLEGVKAGDVVKWSGLVEPHDVIFDTDQVEFSNPLDWRNLYMMLDLHFKTGKSPSERASYADAVQLAKAGSDAELQASRGIPAGSLRPKGISSLKRNIRRFQTFR